MSQQRNVARQEQILAEAQKKLGRIDKMREDMAKMVELEMKKLEELRDVHNEFESTPEMKPSLNNDLHASFQSQFDQFSATKSNERLTTIGNEGVFDFPEKLEAPKDNKPVYKMSDRQEHWTSLTENPGKPVYVSGRYIASGHGTHKIDSTKEYEYELSVRAIPVSVGDVLRAPVHPTGHGDGKAFTTTHLQYQITGIYSNPRFHAYHDRIEG